MLEVGSVIVIENQIFKANNNKNNFMSRVDHAPKRPVVIIAEDDDNFYYLTLTKDSRKPHTKFSYITSNGQTSYVTLENIYQKRIFGTKELDCLQGETLLELLMDFYKYQSTTKKTDPLFKKIEKLILEKIKELTIKQAKHKK